MFSTFTFNTSYTSEKPATRGSVIRNGNSASAAKFGKQPPFDRAQCSYAHLFCSPTFVNLNSSHPGASPCRPPSQFIEKLGLFTQWHQAIELIIVELSELVCNVRRIQLRWHREVRVNVGHPLRKGSYSIAACLCTSPCSHTLEQRLLDS